LGNELLFINVDTDKRPSLAGRDVDLLDERHDHRIDVNPVGRRRREADRGRQETGEHDQFLHGNSFREERV
jgi:hypothetical protein